MDADRHPSVLGRRARATAIVDGDARRPAAVSGRPVWFQQMDEPRTERNRFHIDVSVPHDVADATRRGRARRPAARSSATTCAKSWWVLADADGNEACVCTWQDR